MRCSRIHVCCASCVWLSRVFMLRPELYREKKGRFAHALPHPGGRSYHPQRCAREKREHARTVPLTVGSSFGLHFGFRLLVFVISCHFSFLQRSASLTTLTNTDSTFVSVFFLFMKRYRVINRDVDFANAVDRRWFYLWAPLDLQS